MRKTKGEAILYAILRQMPRQVSLRGETAEAESRKAAIFSERESLNEGKVPQALRARYEAVAAWTDEV